MVYYILAFQLLFILLLSLIHIFHGEVAQPDSYPYADNMTLEDLIIQACLLYTSRCV